MLTLGAIAILLATFLAGIVGFAYGLLALPLLLLIGVPLPVVIIVNLLIGMATRLGVVIRHRRRIDVRRAGLLVAGSLPGMAAGVVIRESVPTRSVEVAAGLMTIAAVAGLSWRPSAPAAAPASGRTLLAAGGLGGMLGITTSLNGVPPALLLIRERASATNMVVDLGAYFVVGNTLTILVLVSRGGGPGLGAVWPLLAVWLPVGLLGQALGVFLGTRLPENLFRWIVLAVTLASGLGSVFRAL